MRTPLRSMTAGFMAYCEEKPAVIDRRYSGPFRYTSSLRLFRAMRFRPSLHFVIAWFTGRICSCPTRFTLRLFRIKNGLVC